MAAVIATMIVGFYAGMGHGRHRRAMAQTQADDAVVKRLAPICVIIRPGSQEAERLRELTALTV